MEDVALGIVRSLSDATRSNSGTPTCPLIRCFASTRRRRLTRRLVDVLDRSYPVERPEPEDRVLVLLATDGEEPEWCDRRQSARHQVLPLTGVDLSLFPMVSQMFMQFGLPLAALRTDANFADPTESAFGVFHVQEAASSAAIPDTEFVRDRGIQSVVGLGGRFPNGEVFATLLFSSERVGTAMAEQLRPVAIGAKLALLPVLDRVFADDSGEATAAVSDVILLQAQLEAMTTLVGFHETLIADEARRSDSTDDLTRRERQLLEHLASGATNKQIAASIGVSTGTVKWHMHNLFAKLGVATRTEAAIAARDRLDTE